MSSKNRRAKKFVSVTDDKKAIMCDSRDIGASNKLTCLGYSASGQSDWVKRTRASDFEANIGKKIGFDLTSPRFNFNEAHFGQSLKFDVPGPGQYKDE